MNNQLNIPLMPQLDSLSLQEVANALEDGGARFSVESLNWPSEYPYRPLTVVTAAHTDSCIYLDFLVRCNYLRAVNFSARCTSAGQCTPLDKETLARIRRYASVGTRPFEEVEGSFIWSIVAAIPLDILGLHSADTPIVMKGNFNKCASATSQPHYLSWTPIHTDNPDFHQPQFFGEIVLDA